MKKQIAIQMDSIESIDYEFDSSFMIAYEAQNRDYEIFYYNPHDLFLDQSEVKARGYYLNLIDDKNSYFSYLSKKKEVNLSNFRFIFLRQDPPFDMKYITSTYILDLLTGPTKVINNPKAVRNSTEKLYTYKFIDYMPPTIVTQNIDDLKNFLKIHQDIITKPLYGNGGEGIYRSKKGFLNGIKNNKKYLDMPIMAQKYIPEISQGDRRIILIDGEYVGSVARLPQIGSIKANFHAGGRAKKTDLVFRDKEIINVLGPKLKKNDLFFVGIDVIGNYLTEINVTSPTGIKQINKLNNVNLERVFWDKLEAKYKIV
ncbi:MAG: glutathione synthase [Pelagibacteraceae bacterium]|nr:glutathione synthase [Pelagibacteraceae bacterium]|tara:strand:+ start:81300 stop:82241 length:942 start_codon:yes stop_codon:yes gene_type:complete